MPPFLCPSPPTSHPRSDPSTGAFVPGNGGSMEKCRRRWDLADAPSLKYKFMNSFDRAIMHLDKAFGFVAAPHNWVSRKDEADKIVVVERGEPRLVAPVCVCRRGSRG